VVWRGDESAIRFPQNTVNRTCIMSVQDEDATTATTWLESASALLSSLLSSSNNDDDNDSGGGVISDVEIEKASASILTSTVGGLLPVEVRRIIKTIHSRALIKLGRYHEVVVSSTTDDDNNREDSARLETAYGLYRTKNYEACRKLCTSILNTTSGEKNSSNSRGLMHIYAQTLYRLNETNAANSVYHELLSSIIADEEEEGRGFIDINDEKEDILSNALANCIVNHTSGMSSLDDSSSTITNENWVVNNADIRKLLDTFCDETARKSGSSSNNNNNNDNILNYDLAYNLATHLLVTHTSCSKINIGTAMNLLLHAKKLALMNNDDIDPTLAEYESYPICANLALSQLLLGGIDNDTMSYRTYLTLYMQLQKNKGKGGGGGATGSNEGLDNILAVISNNIACLRDGKDSLVDVHKRIPSITTSTRRGLGVDDAGGGLLLAGATPNQTRITLYNRALCYARMGNVAQCQETLHALRASLHVSYQGDVSERRTVNGHGGEEEVSNTATITTPTNHLPTSNGNKKKKNNKSGGGVATLPAAVDDTATCISRRKDNKFLTAKPKYDIELLAWEARADLLESEMYRVSENETSSKSMDILNSAIAKLDAADNDDDSVISYTKSQILLYRAAVASLRNESPHESKKAVIDTLDSLPLSVRSCPGSIVTRACLHDDVGSVMGILSSLGDGRRAKLTMAEFYIERGQYDAAVDLLRDIVDEDKDDNDMEATAMLVKALSYIDPSEAEEYAALLQEAMEGGGVGVGVGGISELNGEALECMDIPRFAKQFDNGDGMTSKARKLIATTGGSTHNEQRNITNKKSRESILRKRAKQREAYLSRLEAEGKYTPNNIASKPDPERWIPKNQRSYNRRGRGKYKSNVGAQGGGIGVGMDKDSAKLDVAARVTAAKSGNGEGGDGIGGQKQPSTANIKVSTSTTVRKGKGGKRR